MSMASSLLVGALGLASVHKETQPPGWSPLGAFFGLGQSVVVLEADELHSVAGTAILEARVLRCVRGPWPGHSVFLAATSLRDEAVPGQRFLVLLGSERQVSGTRAFWRKLDRLLDGKPLH